MTTRKSAPSVLAILAFLFAAAQATVAVAQGAAGFGNADEARWVVGNVLTSTSIPAVQLRFGDGFRYVGNQSFELDGISHAEQHFFVEADAVGHVSRLYWIQFEGYLPNNTLSYQYPVTKVVTLGGLDFIADLFARNAVGADKNDPRSDLGRAEAFLRTKDYWIDPRSFMLQRLVHLPTADRRHELMIVYGEDVGEAQVEELSSPNVAKEALWATLSESLIQRASSGMSVGRR